MKYKFEVQTYTTTIRTGEKRNIKACSFSPVTADNIFDARDKLSKWATSNFASYDDRKVVFTDSPHHITIDFRHYVRHYLITRK